MSYGYETGILHRLMCVPDPQVRFTNHALEEMDKDDISITDVKLLLRRSAVTDVQSDNRWRVSGKDLDERSLEAIICIENDVVVIVITAWDRRI